MIFVIATLVVAAVFLFFVSDFRKKKDLKRQDMKELLPKSFMRTVKFMYPLLFLLYLSVLFFLTPTFFDYIALGVQVLGTFIIAKSKFDLGRQHTWAGYRFENTTLVTHGIYNFMRHPLYTGIFLFMLGMLVTILVLNAAKRLIAGTKSASFMALHNWAETLKK